MAKTFQDMVKEGRESAKILSAADAQNQMQSDPKTVVVDVREPDEVKASGKVKGALNIPLGQLPLRADTQLPEAMREMKLQDRSTPVITTCGRGGQASLAAKTLKDMGFTNVSIMDGGTTAWKEAGLPTE